MLLATVVSNEHQLSALAPALGMVLALLGGAMVPIEVFPPVMRTLSHATPHAWAIEALHRLLLNGGGITDILPQLAALLAFAVGLLALASRRFRRQVTGGAA
jgi:ABC-2 type transport system permease protein